MCSNQVNTHIMVPELHADMSYVLDWHSTGSRSKARGVAS